MEKEIKKKETIGLYDFGVSDYFLSRSPKREPFFLKVDRQLIQNSACMVTGEQFQKFLKEYLKILNSPKSKK